MSKHIGRSAPGLDEITNPEIREAGESASKHTPEPWRFRAMGSEGCRIFPDSGGKREDIKFIAMVNGRDFHTDQANAERIVACVNACKGINPEAAPELLEACKWALKECGAEAKEIGLFDVLGAAIAKAEGE